MAEVYAVEEAVWDWHGGLRGGFRGWVGESRGRGEGGGRMYKIYDSMVQMFREMMALGWGLLGFGEVERKG